MAPEPPIQLTGRDLTVPDVVSVARGGRPAAVADDARQRMGVSRAVIERVVESGETVYGVTTGFGDLADVRISPEQTATLQRNLVRSHAAGSGPLLSTEVVRGMLLLRANALAVGLSGIRPEVVDLLVAMLNAGVHPVVPSRGSVGASGDLAPLAHMALVVIGEGEAEVGGATLPGAEALAAAGLEPVELQAKEGLALLNGTQLMAAIGALALTDAGNLVRTADVTGAMSLEAMLGTATAFDESLMWARPHPGQLASAARLRALLADSQIGDSHRSSPHKVQDPYSLRCMPQVHGAVADALSPLGDAVSVELNAATDNPLVFPDGRVVSGGNFHGEPLALGLDHARLALTALATISERRTARILDARLSGLPAFLAADPGLESGLMMAQYTAAAAVNELKTVAHPASADTIPTSANQEDHVSMGATSALLLLDALDRTTTVLAVEALCAARGLDLRAPLQPGRGVAAALAAVREVVPPLDGDRSPAPDISALADAIREGRLAAASA